MKSADDRLGVKVGVIGLGIMGGPMAANLVRAGYDVIGHNRSWAKTERLMATGGRCAETVAEAVSDSDFVITMLPDSPDVLGVALGEDGVFAHAKSGMIYIDMSTIASGRRPSGRGRARARLSGAGCSGEWRRTWGYRRHSVHHGRR
jgi:2-hydroxy-3-oxopropionate reductase